MKEILAKDILGPVTLARTGRPLQASAARASQLALAFIETAAFLLSLISYQQRPQVRWDAARGEIV